MKKTFTYLRVTDEKNNNYGFIISKIKNINSGDSAAISIDPLPNGTWKLTINKSFLPNGCHALNLEMIQECDIIKITGA